MGRVLLDISISLDGFIARQDDDPGPIHDWFFTGDVQNPDNPVFRTAPESAGQIEAALSETGAIISGRRTYDLVDGWGGNHPVTGVPVFVVTHAPPASVPEGATQFAFADGVEVAVEQARAAAGERNVVVMGGVSIARQCLEAGLLDELSIHVTPVLLGRGIPLFGDLDREVTLEQTAVTPAPGVTHLRYRVVR